ncbi:Nucleolar protein Nop52, partial [Reticulomyxa filosa]
IEANGLFLLVYPQHSSQHFDVEAYHRQQLAIKRSQLENVKQKKKREISRKTKTHAICVMYAEKRMIDTHWAFLKQSQLSNESYLDSLLKHFLSNVHINITHVHIRYQDFTTVPYHPFACGLTLEKLTVINLTSSVSEQGQQDDHVTNGQEEDDDDEDDDEDEEIDGNDNGNNSINNDNHTHNNDSENNDHNTNANVIANEHDNDTDNGENGETEGADRPMASEETVRQAIDLLSADPFEDLSQLQKVSNEGLNRSISDNEQDTKYNKSTNEKPIKEKGKSISKKITFKNLAVYMNTFNPKTQTNEPKSSPSTTSSTNENKKKSVMDMLNEDSKVYWNDETLTDEQMIGRLEVIPTQDYRTHDYDFILSPLTLEFVMYLNSQIHYYIHNYADDPLKWKPKTECKISMNRLNMSANKAQLNTIQAWLEAWKFVAARIQ